MAMEAELRAQLVRAVAVVRERRAALSEARRVRRNALERQRYDNRTAPARVARARAALPNFAPRNPRYNSTRMSTGGAAPRRRFNTNKPRSHSSKAHARDQARGRLSGHHIGAVRETIFCLEEFVSSSRARRTANSRNQT
jgi:hypothetical protein